MAASLPSRSLLETHARLMSMDNARTTSTANELSLSEQTQPPVRFFDRGEYFTVLGRDALRLAQEVYHSTSVIKMMSSVPNGGSSGRSSSASGTNTLTASLPNSTSVPNEQTPSLWVSRKQFATVLQSFLVRLRIGVEVWKLDNTSGWAKVLSGSAGALHQFADAVMMSNDDPAQMLRAETGSLGCIVLTRKQEGKGSTCASTRTSGYEVAFASVNTVLNTFSAGSFDTADLGAALTHGQALIAQTPFVECAVVCAAGDPSGIQKPLRDLLNDEEDCVRRVLPRKFFERFGTTSSISSESDYHLESQFESQSQSQSQGTQPTEVNSPAAQQCLQDCARLLSAGQSANNTTASLDIELAKVVQASSQRQGSGTLQAISAILEILSESHPELFGHVRFTYVPCSIGGSMHLSQSAISALSLLPSASTTATNKRKKGTSTSAGPRSVFDLLDECCTSMGSRRLMQWLRAPSIDAQEIKQRLGVVQQLFDTPQVRDRVRTEALKGCPDAKRLVRVVQRVVGLQAEVGKSNKRKGSEKVNTQKQLGALVSLYHFVNLARHVAEVLSTMSDSNSVGERRKRNSANCKDEDGAGGKAKRSRHFGNAVQDDDITGSSGGNSSIGDTSQKGENRSCESNGSFMPVTQLLTPLLTELKTLEEFELLVEKTIDPDSIVQQSGPTSNNTSSSFLGSGGSFFCRANPAFVPALQRIDKRMSEVVVLIRQLAVTIAREIGADVLSDRLERRRGGGGDTSIQLSNTTNNTDANDDDEFGAYETTKEKKRKSSKSSTVRSVILERNSVQGYHLRMTKKDRVVLDDFKRQAKAQISANAKAKKAAAKAKSKKPMATAASASTAAVLKQHIDIIVLSTSKDGVRFVTSELRALDAEYMALQQQFDDLQEDIAIRACMATDRFCSSLERLADGVASIDVLASFAHVAALRNYCRPNVLGMMSKDKTVGGGEESVNRGEGGTLNLVDARHPIIEALDGMSFIPNDVHMHRSAVQSNTESSSSASKNNSNKCVKRAVESASSSNNNTISEADKAHVIILTGPNMGGKSTLLRQTGLAVVMAQIGSFVAATSADIPICDALLVRVWSSDNQLNGTSTFMSEMLDVASILRRATPRSLVLIDELGRGTSAFDGFGLAWGIAHHLAKVTRCLTMFATHFHELAGLENVVNGVANLHVAAKVIESKDGSDDGGEVVLLYKVRPGASDKSYGVSVAKMANMPKLLVDWAQKEVEKLERVESATGLNTNMLVD